MRRRVVITGMGVVAPNAVGLEAYEQALRDGASGIRHVPMLDELGAIEQIRPAGPDESVVSLFDGRVFRLEGTDDVGEGHRGVFVKPDGRPRRLVRWVDVDRVLFER